MKILKVTYELYHTDYLNIKGSEDSEVHEIDREICLEFDSGIHVFVSWADKPVQFSVGYQEVPWFKNESEVSLVATDWKMWKPIIGNDCEFIFLNEDHQVLELHSRSYSIYFSSKEQGTWNSDILHISTKKPTIPN